MNFLDLINTPDYLNDSPITRYFLETKGEKHNWNTVEWLSRIDDDTFSMLVSCVDKLEEGAMKEIPATNEFGQEVFQGSYGVENSDSKTEIQDEIDFSFLVAHCAAAEKGISFDEFIKTPTLENDWVDYAAALAVFITCEGMRRKGIVNFTGPGKISEIGTTDITATEKGKKIMENDNGLS